MASCWSLSNRTWPVSRHLSTPSLCSVALTFVTYWLNVDMWQQLFRATDLSELMLKLNTF